MSRNSVLSRADEGRGTAHGVPRVVSPPRDIRLFHPDVGARELDALAGVVETAWLGRGAQTEYFEREFAAHLGVEPHQLLSVHSATDALFYIGDALQLEPGDEVIVPSISFVGAAQAAGVTGARVVLCDSCPRTLQLRVDDLEHARTPRTRALVLLHYGGSACDMDAIVPWCDAHGVVLVEDAACGPATRWRGRAIGTFGAFAAWSFDSMKIITCGEGGIVYAADPAARASIARSAMLGLNCASGSASSAVERWWELDVLGPGRRSMMGDMAAAIARVQLRRLPDLIDRRRAIDRAYREGLCDVEWITLPPRPDERCAPSFYFFAIQCTPPRRDRLACYLRERGIYTSFRYFPLHRTRRFAMPGASFPGADHAADTTLCLPLHSRLSDSDVGHILDTIRRFAA